MLTLFLYLIGSSVSLLVSHYLMIYELMGLLSCLLLQSVLE